MILQLTTIVYAGEEDELSERDIAVLCGASEDYEETKNNATNFMICSKKEK
jgi:hypothetical protein